MACGALLTASAGEGLASAGAAVVKSSVTLTRSAHVAYETCPAKSVLLTATMRRLTYSQGQPMTVHITVTNTSDTQCGYETTGGTPIGPPRQLTVGQCGEISLVINNAKGQNIYPGRVVINCPDISGPDLPARGSLTATATWNQSAYPVQVTNPWTSHPAPTGHYRLIIDQRISFPVTITAPPPVSASIPNKTTVHTP